MKPCRYRRSRGCSDIGTSAHSRMLSSAGPAAHPAPCAVDRADKARNRPCRTTCASFGFAALAASLHRGDEERPEHGVRALAGIDRAPGIETGAFGSLDDLAPQLDVLGPQATDRDVHMMAIKAAQKLGDDRIIVVAAGEAGHPGLRPGGGEALQVPVEHRILPCR